MASSSGSMIPGRSALKKRPADPKAGRYERSRARDAYKRQLNIFKAKFEASLREYDRLDFDAKQEIRIRAKRQREVCLNDYRQGLQGLARSSFRRTYKDVFLGERETAMESYDPNVLEYELRLTSEMDTIIDNIRLLSADKSNLSKMDWFSNLARAKFSYEYELQNEIDPEALRVPEEEPTPSYVDENSEYVSQPDYDAIIASEIDPEVASTVGSSGYVYRPFKHRNRHNLYSANVDEPDQPEYRYDWQRLYDSKPGRRTIPDYDTESVTDRYDYEPFQPFCDEPMGLRRNRYPDVSLDPEWQSQSSVYAYHRPQQPTPRFTPNRFDTNIDSICPTYGYGDDDDRETITSRSDGMIAGIDYEYKPIIPSYLRNGNRSKATGSSRFNYDQQFNYDDDNDEPSTTSSWQPEQNNRLLSSQRNRQSLSMEPQFSPTSSVSSSAQPSRSHVRFDDDDNQPIKYDDDQ